MGLKETIHRFSFMPAGSIQVKPDRIAPQMTIKMTQDFHEAFSISAVCPNNSITAQKRGHPTREIEALLMLAGRRDAIRMSSLRPSSPQSRMERKSRLILEDDGFPRPQILKFFLTPGEIAAHRSPALEDTHSWPALNDIPVDASRSEFAALSSSIRNGVLSAQPEWGRPNERDSVQNPGETALNELPLPGLSGASNETAARLWACSSGRSIRSH